ncbi:MAG: Asp-tRNA(Asn)/Glu-tRNA(Gln) amidotransferase subunit GatC [Lachnospira sp.]|nr:Asp-tRNA(Asn)/Glu-tRNA(Gln) amidotransferase subunit GatC [Lachnospira sp.]
MVLDKISSLAKLYISEEEREKYEQDMQTIIEYVDRISTLDTDNIEALIDINDNELLLREDIVEPSGLSYLEDTFVVPRTIE